MKPRGPGYQKERGERQQQRILGALQSDPMTVYQLAERLHLNRSTVSKHIRSLTAKPNKRIRIESFILGTGRPRTIYTLGSGRDADIHRFQQARVLEALSDATEPQTIRELAEIVGLTYPSARNYVRALRASRKIYVAEWTWSDRTRMAMFMAGKEPDAAKPTSKPKPVKLAMAPQSWMSALLPKRAAGMREAV